MLADAAMKMPPADLTQISKRRGGQRGGHMQIKRILVPYDFSEYAEHAFRWASGIAEDWGAKVVLVHVVPLAARVSYEEALSPAVPAYDCSKQRLAESVSGLSCP